VVSANSQVRKVQQIRQLRGAEDKTVFEGNTSTEQDLLTKVILKAQQEAGKPPKPMKKAMTATVNFGGVKGKEYASDTSSDHEKDSSDSDSDLGLVEESSFQSDDQFNDSADEDPLMKNNKVASKAPHNQFERQKSMIPPPNPLLQKKVLPQEPVRTGFATKFMDLKHPSNQPELQRSKQGIPKVISKTPGLQMPSSVV
jgi:hypothetical protein